MSCTARHCCHLYSHSGGVVLIALRGAAKQGQGSRDKEGHERRRARVLSGGLNESEKQKLQSDRILCSILYILLPWDGNWQQRRALFGPAPDVRELCRLAVRPVDHGVVHAPVHRSVRGARGSPVLVSEFDSVRFFGLAARVSRGNEEKRKTEK